MNRQGVVSRIDAAGMQLSTLVDELNESLHMRWKDMEQMERVEVHAMIMSLDDALGSLRSCRKMFAIGYSTEKGAQAAAFGLDMEHNEKQSQLAQETISERKAA